ncbi:GNAT family N-acetyltransferase [Paenochrobactrum pullorum]|uniref:GNAT family N-acetyltransferase n=1 Tax=Paenochrobactrum pullorum TaxID=1324351 RepID=UPI0035BC06D3
MAPTEAFNIVQLSEKDMAQACLLSSQAGWNQTEQDWELFFRHGLVFGVFATPEQLAASAAIMPYGDDIAWISMVLTKAEWRGQGFGTSLLKHCLQWIEAQNRTAFLDATPAGEPIYRALGFVPCCKITRWQGSGKTLAFATPAKGYADAAIDKANSAFGANRHFLLDNFNKRYPVAISSDASTVCFVRDGRLAWQIGPVIGCNEVKALQSIEILIEQLPGAVFIDLLDDFANLAQGLVQLGFTKQRPFLRMQKGLHQFQQTQYQTLAIAGPEFG